MSGNLARWPGRTIFLLLAMLGMVAVGCGASQTVESSAIEASNQANETSTPSPTSDTAEGCVTVPTTIPGQVFCDGYDPGLTPTPTSEACPDWASTEVDRPDDGWLGRSWADTSNPRDGLWRSHIDPLDGYQPAADLEARSVSAAPTGFVHASTEVEANAACVERSVFIRLWFDGPAGADLGLIRTRMSGQYEWMEEYFVPDGRDEDSDGTEWAWHDGDSVVKVWMVTPDGTLTMAVAYADNADRKWGYPTTTSQPPDVDRPPVGPLSLTAADLRAFVAAVAG